MMDPRSIVIYLNRKGLTLEVVHEDLVVTLGAEAIAYRMVANYLRTARIIPRDSTVLSAMTSPHIDESGEAILTAFSSSPMGAAYPVNDQKAIPVQCSRSLLTILLAHETRALQKIVARDESWFEYITDHGLIWPPPDGKVPNRERFRIQSKK
jgi:hypothetical protein